MRSGLFNKRDLARRCRSLGLRREELWALKWSDFGFIKGTVKIQRTMVDKVIYATVKTKAAKPLPLSEALLKLLLAWRGQSQFNKDTDWVWASPFSAGERPLNLNGMQPPQLKSRPNADFTSK